MCWNSAKPWSITARLTCLYVLSAAVILCSIGWYLHQTLVDAFAQDNQQFLLKEIQLLQTVLQQQPLNSEHLSAEQNEGVDLPVGRYYSRIFSENGQPLSETAGASALLAKAQFPAATEVAQAKLSKQTLPDGRTLMLMSVYTTAPSRHIIQIALDTSHEAALLVAHGRNLLAALLIGLLFSSVAGLLVARRGLQPLTDMTRHIRGITATQLDEQLEPRRWPAELSTVAAAFNEMLQRLAKSFNQLNQFSADLAHELRTPINNLMGETEVALAKPRSGEEYQEILASNLEEYLRLSRIVETLLFLARAENTEISLCTKQLDGRAELEAACSYHEGLAEEKNIQLLCQGHGFLHADSQLLKRVLSNLLLNAIAYTPIGGRIQLSIKQAEDGSAEIRVQDSGCGIAAEHLPKLFDRFYRVDSARSMHGTGLGLAIVKSIIELHGGTVTINSTVKQGTSVTVKFPLPVG
ncbi:MAG: heavy metal sensor histidine kinase [Methylomonas sp.]|uniref:heavy metal sensor histidine kinase n=1 Tax=Methylomonas sp. TaxID=418 RepID=UPI0025F58E76|nr:heavy metal sensor histidine kinase [Methylomonas sp.]MCK9607471.1 heavy metal sensor histidine kinase [Methylomonas sp.]